MTVNVRERLAAMAAKSAGPRRARTKVVATIGPASENLIGELIDAGVSVARVNFSHGSHEEHRRRVRAVRAAARERDVAVAVLADIQGPKLRLGFFEDGRRRLRPGDRLTMLEGSGTAGPDEILFDFDGFVDAVEIGDRVFLADGAVEVLVENRRGGVLEGRVRRGGVVGDRKGFHLPDSHLALDMPTEKDVADLALALEMEVDMIGASFISEAEDLRRIRALVPNTQVVAKIERARAVEHLDEILEEADGIMVARGDLGVEIDLVTLPIVQKDLLQRAKVMGKFSIIATEMLESMVSASRPTRAEVTDIANAVLDGADAVMLSAETAMGAYPVEAVATMVRIARSVEASDRYSNAERLSFRSTEPTVSNAVAKSAVDAAAALKLRYIVCFTETGNSLRLLSRYRPTAQLVAMTPHVRTMRSMAILAHTEPVLFPRLSSLEEMLMRADEMLLERKFVEQSELIAYVAGVPPGVAKSTNVLKLHRVGEHAVLGRQQG